MRRRIGREGAERHNYGTAYYPLRAVIPAQAGIQPLRAAARKRTHIAADVALMVKITRLNPDSDALGTTGSGGQQSDRYRKRMLNSGDSV